MLNFLLNASIKSKQRTGLHKTAGCTSKKSPSCALSKWAAFRLPPYFQRLRAEAIFLSWARRNHLLPLEHKRSSADPFGKIQTKNRHRPQPTGMKCPSVRPAIPLHRPCLPRCQAVGRNGERELWGDMKGGRRKGKQKSLCRPKSPN